MIIGRHISKDWQTFLPPTGHGREYALCGKRTLVKYLGVPGITNQMPVLSNATGETHSGWCQNCAYEALKIATGVLKTQTNINLRALYENSANVLSMSLSVH